jgi:hypothetical protein
MFKTFIAKILWHSLCYYIIIKEKIKKIERKIKKEHDYIYK